MSITFKRILAAVAAGFIIGAVLYFRARRSAHEAETETPAVEKAQQERLESALRAEEEARRLNPGLASPSRVQTPAADVQRSLRTIDEINRLNRMNQEMRQRKEQQQPSPPR